MNWQSVRSVWRARRIIVFVLAALPAQSQLVLTPSSLDFRMVQGGPLPPRQAFSISEQGGEAVPWTASVAGGFTNVLQLSSRSGATPASVSVSWESNWAAGRAPGEYSIAVTVAPQAGTPATLSARLSVVPKAPGAVFTYLDGPNGCTQPAGYADAALCVVPDEKPPGNFSPPAVGGTYVDPNFGAFVKILSNPPTNHAYSTPSPVSAKNRYVFVFDNVGTNVVYAADGKIAYPKVPADLNNGTFWDAYDDTIYYYFSGKTVKRHNLRTGQTVTVVDYSSPPYGFTSITAGGTGDGSKDNWIAFFAPAQKQVCALDLSKVKTYCAGYDNVGTVPVTFVDFPLIAKGVDSSSGKRYLLLMANPSFVAFSVNLSAGRLDFEFRGPENPEGGGNHNGVCDPGESCFGAPHSDVFEDEQGIQYLVSTYETQTPCERSVSTFRINSGTAMLTPVELGGGRTTVMTLFRCGGQAAWTGDHIGCARAAPYCVISTNYDGLRDPASQYPIRRTPHLSEIFVMKGNGLEIRRLAEHRSVPFQGEEANGYWTLARAAISADGGFVVTDSNFGAPGARRVVLITTGYGKPQIASAGLVSSASFNIPVAPGSYVTLSGSSFTAGECAAAATQLPLPDTLCGTTVAFNGQPVRLSYADSWQVNAILPNTFPLGQPLQVVVSRSADASPPLTVSPGSVLEVAPAVFTYTLEDGVQRAIVSNSDWSLNGPPRTDIGSRPMSPGEYGHVWTNGLGPTSVFVADGTAAPNAPLAWSVRSVEVYVNGFSELVGFSGLAPGLAALYQVDFYLDPSTPVKSGDQNLLWLKVDGIESPRLVVSLVPAG